MIRICPALMVPFVLQGCAAGLGEEYSCAQIGGVNGCTTMGEIRHQMGVPSDRLSLSAHHSEHTTESPQTLSPFLVLPRRDRHGVPERTSETVRKITIFPFTTKDGHYVDTTDVYLIIHNSQWSGRPAPEIWKD